MGQRYLLHSYYPTHCYAHGNYDFEHYEVQYYDMSRKCKIVKRSFCEAGCCDTLPFNFEAEAEIFDSLETVDYWRNCGVDEKLIMQALESKKLGGGH